MSDNGKLTEFLENLEEARLFLTQVQHYLTDPNGTLAILIYRHWLAIEIVQIFQLLEVGVAMTAQYQIDVAGGWGYLGIINAIYLPAQWEMQMMTSHFSFSFSISVISFALVMGSRYLIGP